MDVRSLTCFVAVAEELHFRRAAERVCMSQPALSARIQTLEAVVGSALLARDRRHVALTPAGQAFLPSARAVLHHANAALLSARQAARGEVGRLRVGFTVIAMHGVLAERIQAFRRCWPDVVLELVEMNSPDQEVALKRGQLDVGVLHPPLSGDELTVQELPPEPLRVALPTAHRLARRVSLSFLDLAEEPILVAPRAVGPHLYDRLMSHFDRVGVTPRVVQEATPVTTLLALVAAGVGVGFAPACMASAQRRGVVLRRLAAADLNLPMAVAWHPSTTSSHIERLVQQLHGD